MVDYKFQVGVHCQIPTVLLSNVGCRLESWLAGTLDATEQLLSLSCCPYLQTHRFHQVKPCTACHYAASNAHCRLIGPHFLAENQLAVYYCSRMYIKSIDSRGFTLHKPAVQETSTGQNLGGSPHISVSVSRTYTQNRGVTWCYPLVI